MIGSLYYQEGMFLGKEELSRQQELMRSLLVSSIRRKSSVGLFDLQNLARIIIRDGKLDLSATVSEDIVAGVDVLSNIIVIPGALSSERCQAEISSAGNYDVYLSYKSHSHEKGIINIDGSGYVTGNGTEFTKIFRNSFKGRFSRMKTSDGEIRQVQNVIDDTNLQLYGEANNFTAGQNLQFEVYPTLSTFYTGDDEHPVYLYDFSGLSLYAQNNAPDQAESLYFKLGQIVLAEGSSGWEISSWSWNQLTKLE